MPSVELDGGIARALTLFLQVILRRKRNPEAEAFHNLGSWDRTTVDIEVPMLAKMYKRRLAGYKAIGYEIVE